MTTIHWKSGINGLFGAAADWSPSQVPNAGDNVFIDAAGTYTVTSSANHTIKTLSTVSTATLAVKGGTFTISSGTGSGANMGAVGVSDAATLAIGGTFENDGKISLNSTGDSTDLVIDSNTTLSGAGKVVLSAGGHNLIVSDGSAVTLTNASNTISGAGKIGDKHLTLVNAGIIDGDSKKAALTINTGSHSIINSGLLEGTTAKGLVIVSNVSNTGTIEALGANARMRIDGTVTNGVSANGKEGAVEASGDGAHVGLASAKITQGTVQIGSNSILETVAGSGLSVVSGVNLLVSGTLKANSFSTLSVTESYIPGTAATLISNGNGSLLSIDGTIGAVTGTIDGGEIEFKGASAANITFTQSRVGTLKIDASTFTGTVAGLAGGIPLTFTSFFAFGDSTIDSGALQYLSPDLPSPPNPGLTDRLQNALDAGGTDSPVGVGMMDSQLLAADFGLAANTAYTTGGGIGGGGTNYAIAGALDAADPGDGGDPGNGSIGNINQVGTFNPNPQLLSTIDQIENYLNSSGGSADPNALYLISSGGNDYTYASKYISGSAAQQAYLSAEAKTLATEIQHLSKSGAQHIIVNDSMSNQSLAIFYSGQLFADLDAFNIAYIKSDIHAMTQDVEHDPTAYGFADEAAVVPWSSSNTQSGALIEPDTMDSLSGWGLWGANKTAQQDPTGVSVPLNHQYAYLRSTDAENTNFFSDDQHLSAAGQQIEANFDYNLVADDAIDLTNIPYVFGNTKASYSGTSMGGTLSVTDGSLNATIALLGNYMASTFVTASDGGTGTLVMEQSSAAQEVLLAQLHSPS